MGTESPSATRNLPEPVRTTPDRQNHAGTMSEPRRNPLSEPLRPSDGRSFRGTLGTCQNPSEPCRLDGTCQNHARTPHHSEDFERRARRSLGAMGDYVDDDERDGKERDHTYRHDHQSV